MKTDPVQMNAARYLILHLLEEAYPRTVPMPELKARYLQLIREHGSPEKAAAVIKFEQQQKGRLQ